MEFTESMDGSHLIALYKNYTITKRNQKATQILETLFEVLFGDGDSSKSCISGTEESSPNKDEDRRLLKTSYVTTKLFEALRKHHIYAGDACQEVNIIMPSRFLPKLCNYQMKSVKWLLAKEKTPSTFRQYFDKLEAKDKETIVHRHSHTGYLQNEQHHLEVVLHPGGILAEEMGLGKTVEMIALILLHPRGNIQKNPRLDSIIQTVLMKKRRTELEVFCICTSKSQRKVIQCSKCFLWQHTKCVTKYNDDHDDEVNNPYMCPSCWNSVISEGGLLKAKGTFIVSPSTIKLQWLSEIKRHTQPSLRVFLYEGIVSGKWISPRQLADYDVILSDYNILSKEIYYTNENDSDRLMRNKPRSIRMKTPILMLEWYRVCLDEAQMVESNTSNVASLVRMLPGIYLFDRYIPIYI